MCSTCEAKELESTIQSKLEEPKRLEELEARNNQKMQDARDEVKSYGDFFNARVTPIVQVKKLYDLEGKTFAEFHERIKLQIEHFAKVLFEQQIEITQDVISKLLIEDVTSKLLIEFRAEIRQKIKDSDINYQPPTKAPKVNAPGVKSIKKSPIEKMAEMIVGAEAKKGNIISMAEATRRIRSELGTHNE